MADADNERQLKRCLEASIEAFKETMESLNSQRQSQLVTLDTSLANNPSDTNIYTFTLDANEESLMREFKTKLENVLNEHLPLLNNNCRKYLLDFLHQNNFDYEQREFTTSFNIGLLDSFASDLRGMLASLDAFQAAWQGKQSEVQDYIKKYPTTKNKSGVWGTTLLYSAAKNNHLSLVRYLIRTARCSVNAQNQQHIQRALAAPITDHANYNVNPTAGSTALHGACFNGHLDVVKFLIEEKADYFIRNHAEETPIMNAELKPDILEYFRNFLVLGYSLIPDTLPDKPILEENDRLIVDCVWEYKPFPDEQWFPFSGLESAELQQSLIVKPDQEFKLEIHLKVPGGVYSVSLMPFLRSGKGQDYEQNLAWVRCRGSSIANFNCYALWQIMFTKYPNATSDSSLKMLRIPAIYDSNFKIKLDSWYHCDARTNTRLDQTMKYRRKYINLDLECISNEKLIFDLQHFAFSNTNGTISGFIRWIPKMISNNSRNRDKLIGSDEFQILANMDMIPLTTSRLKQVSQAVDQSSVDDEEDLGENTDEDDSSMESISCGNNYDKHDSVDQVPVSPINVTWSVKDMFDDATIVPANTTSGNDSFKQEPLLNPTLFSPSAQSSMVTTDTADDTTEKKINDCINESVAQSRSPEQELLQEKINVSGNPELLEPMNSQLSQIKKENETLQATLDLERLKVQELFNSSVKQTTEHEQNLSQLMKCIEDMEKTQQRNDTKKRKLEQIAKSIKTIEYNHIQQEVIHHILTPKFSLILDYLRTLTENLDSSFTDWVPRMLFQEKHNQYVVIIVGFQAHQDGFKAILQRIWSLLNVIESAKEFYQRHLNRIIRTIMKETLPQVSSKTQNWHEYVKLFGQLLQEKTLEYGKRFNDYVDEQSKLLLDQCILAKLDKPWIIIQKETDNFITKHSLMDEIESIKRKVLDNFIEQNIFVQRVKLDMKPTAKSVAVLQQYIDEVRTEFRREKKYQGHDVKHFALIPKLLERLMLYYSSFKIQLPLFESSKELLDKIEKNAVTTISTSTGSGKSTLLPALLVAEGYDKVIVTQPRRLPCQLICKRVNETMATEVRSSTEKLAGWAVAGAQQNPEAKVLYLTDGLLKERLLYDENFITNHTQLNKSVVFFIDEVHERSVNIDLCLALLARLLTVKPELKLKMKVIISSATLDASVPTLFSQIPQAGLAEFKMPQIGTLHPVTKVHRPKENVLDIVQELCKKRRRHDQILCFVSSVSEVNQCCRLIGEISRGTIVAYPLIQSLHPNVQQTNIEHGTVFFSTTVAETSLTFPCLKYVIDTGMINTPVYDFQSKRTVLKEVRAAESTIKQRLGRLGRTQPGEYYSVYNFKVEDLRFPIPQICQSDLMNIEFSLRKSPLQKGIDYMKAFLPDKPSQQVITAIIEQLKQWGIVEKGSGDQLTNHGKALAKLPDFGSLAMSKAVLAALRDYDCGHDLICLTSMLGVLNSTVLFKSIPQHLKSPDGDFMTLVNVMNEILLVKQSSSAQQFDLDEICRFKGLTDIRHIIKQAMRRYATLEKTFNLSPDYRERAQVKSGNWQLIAQALLAGYSNNVFVSMKELQDRIHHFVRYGEKGDIAVLDLQSTLTRPISTAPVSLILARDIRHSTAIRATAILSFVGEIKPEWIEYLIERDVYLNNEEEGYLNNGNRFLAALSKFSNRINMLLSNRKISLKGSAGIVLNAELHIRQQMISECKFLLRNLPNTTPHENFTRNLESVMKMPKIFNPMIWRWQAEKQVKITVNSDTATKTCEITIKGRDSDNQKVKQEFDSFISWLQPCAVIRHPNAGVSPRVLRPQMRKNCRDIEEKIARVTDSKRTPIDLYNGVKGTKATRETRMEVVAWIAVCKFDCKLEGGFVRDWIVGNYTARPANLLTNPKGWIQYNNIVPHLHQEVIPGDLDCHLPSYAYFDINKFQDELHKYDITCAVFRENWRYVLLLDENESTGPFTMDLIEPHVALTHDRIDFDVSNLLVEKDYTHELGMRIDIQRKPYSIELENIVEHIKTKQFQVLRPIDHHITEKINKMTQVRGWTQTGEPLSVIPEPHYKHHAILVPLPRSTALYTDVSNKMKTIGSVRILSIEEIKNPYLEETYEGMKKLIKKQCPQQNPNEQELFHGTKGPGIDGIVEDGFDDRFFNTGGMYGHGAYFADNPRKSHDFTALDPRNQTRVMFYNKVLLGNPSILTAANNLLVSAPVGFHSVIGKQSQRTEYIIYRYGQALPYLKIIYRV